MLQSGTQLYQAGRMKEKIKNIKIGVDEGLLCWKFTGVSSVSLKYLSYVETEMVGQSLTGPSQFLVST